MGKEERNLHFTLLDAKEKSSRLERLASQQQLITVWVKGSLTKEQSTVSSIEIHSQSLILNIPGHGSLIPNGEVLYSFTLRGVSYFGKGRFESKNVHAFLTTKGDLFKCERRVDFRLSAYPLHQIYTNLVIKDEYKKSNDSKVVSIKSGIVSDTQLFRDFLKFTGQQNVNGEITAKLRVFDISASGLGLLIGEIEKETFKIGTILEDLEIVFDDIVLKIDKATVVYCIDAITINAKAKQFKVGIEFNKIEEKTEKLLRERINESLSQSEIEKDFEEFIK